MATALLPVIQNKIEDESIPYVIISHSCGNWIAYELLRLLRSKGLPLPKMFFVSCMASPDIASSAKVCLSLHLSYYRMYSNIFLSSFDSIALAPQQRNGDLPASSRMSFMGREWSCLSPWCVAHLWTALARWFHPLWPIRSWVPPFWTIWLSHSCLFCQQGPKDITGKRYKRRRFCKYGTD